MTSGDWSVRRRMVALALLMTLLAWLVGSGAALLAARDANARLRDARLMELARTIGAFAEHELVEIGALGQGTGPPASSGAPAATTPTLPLVHIEDAPGLARRYQYQIWSPAGTLLLRSPDAPADSALVPERRPGFGHPPAGSAFARTFMQPIAAGGMELHVADTEDDDDTTTLMLGPLYFTAMAISVAAVWSLAAWFVLRTLRPLAAAERQLRGRRLSDLAPLDLPDAPREMRPLLAAFNDLLRQAAEKLSQERGFTAVAAHELRTPLAALRMQAQVAAREGDPARRAALLHALASSVDRCDHLVEQLLTLARVEQSGAAKGDEWIELEPLCASVVKDVKAQMAARGLGFDLQLHVPRMRGSAFGIETLLRNLIGNAVQYTPAGGRIELTSEPRGDRVYIVVDDSGPGIAPADRARAFDRFVRLDTAGGARGVGLGLAIVRSVAEAHGASAELVDSPLGGLRVEVRFPAAAGPDGSHDRGP